MQYPHLLEGKFVIVVDHSPNVLIGPTNFLSFFRNIDDRSTRWMINFILQNITHNRFFLSTYFTSCIYCSNFI
ncbi:spore germination protein [Bacillus sp. FDAARGOS_1420]|uniref:spore germination protein n=1 Tax=Bacillus sp. FDAARGOS_1420 TaxID=2856338 RepID=UPI001C5B43D0|nr:spore germination protein [Bacillus sp. FDAARGOS_1420]